MTHQAGHQAASAAPSTTTDRPPSRPVRHCFCRYPLVATTALIAIAAVAAAVGSPNWPRDSIKQVSTQDPGGAILAFTQELAGTSSSVINEPERGLGSPAEIFVLDPLSETAPLLGYDVQSALKTYEAAATDQQKGWAAAYETALGTITPEGGGGDMATASPDYSRIATLSGDFGPVPVLAQAALQIAQTGLLEQYLQGVHPGHDFHLVNVWLYDHPQMLNTASEQGLTDDQWGMVKERGFAVGPWYLVIPAIVHVKLPNGATGGGFVLDNLLIALFLLFAVPFVPGLRDLPRYLRIYRLIYRYPKANELDAPENAPWPEGYHGRGVAGEGVEGP